MTDTTATETAEAPQDAEASELDAYKARVRHLALRLKERFDWCDDETNEHLEALDLELLPHRKTFTFTVPTTGVVTYQVSGYSEEEALAKARELAADDAARRDRGSRGFRWGNSRDVRVDLGKLTLASQANE